VIKECAIVPDNGILYSMPASTLEVPSKPPKYEYLEALMPPSGPCARRSPNSTHRVLPERRTILEAFVATRVGKLIRLSVGVSSICTRPSGPVSVTRGTCGKAISPSRSA
jgi:hypothetical protein